MIKIPIKLISIALVFGLVLALSGCTNNTNISANAKQKNTDLAAKEKVIMDNYNGLTQKKDVTIPSIINFLDANIAAVSPDKASVMVIGLEQIQKEKLAKFQDRFYEDEAIQKTLAQGYKNGFTDSYISNIQNNTVKELIIETKNSGYKIETAEGMYYPVIDYAFLNKYRSNVTPDIAAFIDIMAKESDETPIKDAALMISWAEILNRAEKQEQFIREYGQSAKVDDIRELLKQYAAFALYGANNTPLFSYETKLIVPEAKKTYLAVSFYTTKGAFSKAMAGYIEILNKQDYKLTEEVQNYRNKATAEIR